MARSFLTDEMWERLAPMLPPERGGTGRPQHARRPWLEAIFWKHRTGAPWRDVPGEFGSWKSIYCRFNRWSKVGVWQCLLEALRREADSEWLMLDASVIRAHQHAAGAKKRALSIKESGDPGVDSRLKST